MTVTTWIGQQSPKSPLASNPAPPTLTASITTARAGFLAAITQSGNYGFEASGGLTAGSATFTFTGGTATWTNTSGAAGNRVVGAELSGPALGRYNMTAGVAYDAALGGAYGHWLEGTGVFTYVFSAPVGAIAFYLTDLGDFRGTLGLSFYSGSTLVYSEATISNALTDALGRGNGNLAFYGMASTVTFDRVVFQITQSGSNTDVVGFDEFVVGVSAAPAPAPAPSPAPAPAPAPDYWPGQAWPWPCGDVSI